MDSRRRGGLPAVFDFDNTIVCGDIGEATLACLARDGAGDARPAFASLAPEFRDGAAGWSRPDRRDPTAYYEDWLDPTAHGANDLARWRAAMFGRLKPWQGWLFPTSSRPRRVFAMSEPGSRKLLAVVPGGSAYPVPGFIRSRSS
jgi:hypothetical protein